MPSLFIYVIALVIILLIGFLLMLVLAFLEMPILYTFGAAEIVNNLPHALDYFDVIVIGITFFVLTNTAGSRVPVLQECCEKYLNNSF